MRDFATHNEQYIGAQGTSLVGEFKTTYKTLVDLFGEPLEESADGKSKAQRIIIDNDFNVVATIYDYKTNLEKEENADWHIGGHDKNAIELVRQIFEENRAYFIM